MSQGERMDSSDSDAGPATQNRKRGISQILSSPTQRSSKRTTDSSPSSGQHQQHTTRFCTQRCLLGLQEGSALDGFCPNVHLHQQGQEGDRHNINAKQPIQLLKEQLNQDLDHNCTPFRDCGSYSAPFKITCAKYGYTVVGKRTTSQLWKEVSRKAEIYRVLQKVQGLAIPVFLEAINLKMIFFLHRAGKIRHMLLIAWGGECIGTAKSLTLRQEISWSKRQVRKLGVVHQDLRLDNMPWNDELGRVMIIDFHRSRIDCRPMRERVQSLKRTHSFQEAGRSKQPRLVYT